MVWGSVSLVFFKVPSPFFLKLTFILSIPLFLALPSSTPQELATKISPTKQIEKNSLLQVLFQSKSDFKG